jgi:hypothetical protein
MCGYSGSTVLVEAHQVTCLSFAAAYRASPDSVRGVAQEHEHWLAAGRAGERAAAHDKTVADTGTRRAAMAARFATRDLLDDEE